MSSLGLGRPKASSICCASPVPPCGGRARPNRPGMRCFPVWSLDHLRAGELGAVGIFSEKQRGFLCWRISAEGNSEPHRTLEICCQVPTGRWRISEEHQRLRVNGGQGSPFTSADCSALGSGGSCLCEKTVTSASVLHFTEVYYLIIIIFFKCQE